MDRLYIETEITTDNLGRALVPYGADKIINCTVRDGRYYTIVRWYDIKEAMVYLFDIYTFEAIKNTTVILSIRYLETI